MILNQNTHPYAHKVKNLGLRFRCTITCFAGINQRTGCGRVVDQYTSLCVIYNNAVSSIVFNRTSFSAINFYFVSIATFECIHLIAVKNFQNFFLEHHKLFCFHTQFVNKTPSPKIGKVIRFLLIFYLNCKCRIFPGKNIKSSPPKNYGLYIFNYLRLSLRRRNSILFVCLTVFFYGQKPRFQCFL